MSRLTPTETICCATCGYWSDEGECRRLAPIYVENLAKTVWPTTLPADWCGEWDADDGAEFAPSDVND